MVKYLMLREWRCTLKHLEPETECEHQADQTEPCTYWGCVPGLHSHPHIGTCRSRRCWCIAGCRGAWWSTHQHPRKSSHHPSGRSQASIYTDTNKQICGLFVTKSSNQYLTKPSMMIRVNQEIYGTSVTRTHKKSQIAWISFSEAPLNPFLIQCFNLEDLSADLPVQPTNGWAKGSALMCSLSGPAPHMAEGRLSVF